MIAQDHTVSAYAGVHAYLDKYEARFAFAFYTQGLTSADQGPTVGPQ